MMMAMMIVSCEETAYDEWLATDNDCCSGIGALILLADCLGTLVMKLCVKMDEGWPDKMYVMSPCCL